MSDTNDAGKIIFETKIVKNTINLSTIVQNSLEPLLLIQCERAILYQVDGDQIINVLRSNSK